MSLYNMIFGESALSDILLSYLKLDRNKVPRYRDCYIEKDKIVIHTRTGGGNRDYYDSLECCKECYPEYFKEGEESEWPDGPWNSDLVNHSNYLYDEDDDFDATYANFYFSINEEDKEFFNSFPKETSPEEKWKQLFEKLNNEN